MISQATHYIGLSFDKKGKYDENDDDPSCWEGGVKGGNMMLSENIWFINASSEYKQLSFI